MNESDVFRPFICSVNEFKRYSVMLRSLLARMASWIYPKSHEAYEFWDQISSLRDEGRFVEAYSVFCRAIQKYPQVLDSGDICVMLAELELSANMNHQEALRLLDRATKQGYTKETRYYRVHGMAIWQDGQHEAAIADLERAVSLDADSVNLIPFAERLSFVDDSRASDIWLRILEKEPENCMAHAYLARESIKAGNSSAALRWAEKAAQLNPSGSDLYEIGHIYHGLSRFRDAIQFYARAKESGYENRAAVLASMAACHISLGEPAQAKADLEEASLYDSDDDYVKLVWQEYQRNY